MVASVLFPRDAMGRVTAMGQVTAMGRVTAGRLLVVALWLCGTIVCDSSCPKYAEKPLETRVQDASIVFRAVVVQSYYERRTLDLALVSIYRGGVELASVSQYAGSPYNTTDRQVNLKISRPLQDCFNWSYAPAQSELIVFARVSDPAVDFETTPPDGPWLEATCAAVPWSLGVDIAIWNAVGWAGWGEWGACSRSCGGGLQLRRRYCSARACEGYEEQRRACNTFLCDGAINPLAPGARRNFHPAQARWGRVADRPHAFSLRPNSYIWIASSELFGADRAFPREFTLFVSLRLRPESGGYGQGTLFSLRSRRRTGAFLSLELTGRGAARLLHAGAGATSAIYLPVPLYDFRWHHIAISVHDDNTVRAYVDCRWLRTDVLAPGALDTPRDADLIIGYLFSGDLEQLVLVPKAGQAHKQCSSQIVGVSPSTDTNEV
ncbi:hypothetical protein JYU34_017267 [Plutella xylostella]|uniref:Laminin G domain-containing protein n=1 Tax=Plutella xylostella TaxID=51655 RepID=A0ABQ7Q0U1_PLUXY|nr:uncharacterized protein LOC105388201 [Plutella xylostella]KAG7298822.1 hypothetical protein JYU34_017267 [Plutella xylostella]